MYTKQDLIEQSGLSDRTIRAYQQRGLIPKTVGHGPAAIYDEAHMAWARVIGRMRADGEHIDVIAERIGGWSTTQCKRYLAHRERQDARERAAAAPPSDPAARPGDPAAPPSSLDGGSAPTALPLTASTTPVEASHELTADFEEQDLPHAPRWRIFTLLPGMALMVEDEAAPVVRRLAVEILAKYAQRRR